MRRKILLPLCILLLAVLLIAPRRRGAPSPPEAPLPSRTFLLPRSTWELTPSLEEGPVLTVLQSREEARAFWSTLPDRRDRCHVAKALATIDYPSETVLAVLFLEGCSANPAWYRVRELRRLGEGPNYRLVLLCQPPETYGGSDSVMTAYCSLVLCPKTDFGTGKINVHIDWAQ